MKKQKSRFQFYLGDRKNMAKDEHSFSRIYYPKNVGLDSSLGIENMCPKTSIQFSTIYPRKYIFSIPAQELKHCMQI